MRKLLKNSLLILALLSVMFTSCKKDYPVPDIIDLPVGTVYSIDSILKMRPGTVFTKDASVYGIVTADELSGNLYKAAFMQDRATGAAIELYLNATSGLRRGDSIRVYLKDVKFDMYNGLPQLSNFEADGHIVILANNKPITPVEVTLADVLTGNYLGQLVKVKNIKFTNVEPANFAESNTYGNRTVVDVDNTSNYATVRTSNYANFAENTLPKGKGSLVCIASLYSTSSGDVWQLIIPTISDVQFDGYYTVLPYFQEFGNDFGSYTPYSVVGDQVWEISHRTASITGYYNKVNYANEDWLISSPVAISGIDHAKVRVNYVAQYTNSNNEDVTLWVSTNYEAGADPSQVEWTKLPVTFPNTTGWDDFQTVEASLDNYIGQTVVVAVKFLSTESQSRTMEVKFVSVEEGTTGGGGGGGGGTGGDVQAMPYSQSFAEDFGTYVTIDVEGPQSWYIDYSTAKMTGFVSTSESHANEDWLISSPVAVTGVEHAKMTMVYIGRYFGNINNEVTIWASTDYNYGDNPASATWTQVPSTLKESNSWSNFVTTEISLDDHIGQTVTLAVKYLSTDSTAGTVEIQSITVQEGQAGGDTPTPPTPGPGGGSGTADDPYNVASGIALQGQEIVGWVQGYIVGAARNGLSTVSSNDDVIWSAPFDSYTNVLIADDPTCNEISLCVIVNLPSGKPLRSQVNLFDNPDNLGKTLAVNGKLRTYFGQAGLRDSGGTENDFVLEGGTPTPPTPGTTIFSESFANGQGSFTIQDVVLPEGLTYVWAHNSQYSCMKASAFVSGQAYATESWLVSPRIDMSNVSTATLSFNQALNYANSNGLAVMVSSSYTGDVTTTDWNELDLSAWPAGNNWTFIASTADLTPYVGQTVNIAFKYTSTSSASATWEVKNVVVAE